MRRVHDWTLKTSNIEIGVAALTTLAGLSSPLPIARPWFGQLLPYDPMLLDRALTPDAEQN
jgi:hypothetical protein